MLYKTTVWQGLQEVTQDKDQIGLGALPVVKRHSVLTLYNNSHNSSAET